MFSTIRCSSWLLFMLLHAPKLGARLFPSYCLYRLNMHAFGCTQRNLALYETTAARYRRSVSCALGSLLVKQFFLLQQGCTDCSCDALLLFFIKNYAIDHNVLFFFYDIKSILALFMEFYNIFFFAGVYAAGVSLYLGNSFLTNGQSLQKTLITSAARDYSCVQIRATRCLPSQHTAVGKSADITLYNMAALPRKEISSVLTVTTCTIGLCSKVDQLWYFDLGMPALVQPEYASLFFFELLSFGLVGGLGQSLACCCANVQKHWDIGCLTFLRN